MEPRALETGWCFGGRFEVKRILGRGGFGIAYLAADLLRGDLVVIKELAPQGTHRTAEGVLRLDSSGGKRLREQFMEEAGILSRFDLKGVPPIRATFQENGTAYFATDYVEGSATLQALVESNVRFAQADTLDVCHRLLDILEAVHAKRILHRDIKPSNILISHDGDVYLIDFGAAREWHADSTVTHTILHTPGYAPPEQLSERARRGPATDLYAVSATLYFMLVGVPPPSASERASGMVLPSLLNLRPELDPQLVRAIEIGLTLAYAGRPQNVADYRDLLTGHGEAQSTNSLEELDETQLRLNRFTFDRRSCPACKDLLVEPRPLRRYACPVCQEGVIKKRDIHDRLCPACRTGVLTLVKNSSPLAICPNCRRGILAYKRRSMISLEQVATCGQCEARFEVRAGKMADMNGTGEFRPSDHWLRMSGRASEVWVCPDCPTQFDVRPDGRWENMTPSTTQPHRVLYPDEWARVAIGLEPGAGNAQCDACAADYYLDKDRLTLLDAARDHFGFAADYTGRLITLEDARWLGAGKTSPHPGLVCRQCHTEFDKDQPYLRLVATPNRRLARYLDQPKVVEDWHRIAQNLPTIDAEGEFADNIEGALKNAYRNGRLSFDSDGAILWKGEATKLGDTRSATLTITHYEIVFGGMLLKKKNPIDAIVGVWADDLDLHLQLSGARERVGYRVTPVALVAHLSSGDRKVTVDAQDLAARLVTELGI